MFGDSNGQIKLRAKQKFKFLSATDLSPFEVRSPGRSWTDMGLMYSLAEYQQ